jgi:hypothetical protein|tara:strand:+ start:545 stop:832 length:288 start_codon:yes stop_codon:yes gene_type:complete
MKDNFFKSKDSDKGIFLEVGEDSISLSLWKKANSTTINLDTETALELSNALRDNSKDDSIISKEDLETMRDWENHIIEMHTAPNPEQLKKNEKRD